jgi:uncharacterized protein YggE
VAALGTEATVQVRGDAVVRAEPDEALLLITLTSTADSPGPALSDVSARSSALAAMLDDLTIAKSERTTTGITVHEEFDHTPQGRRSLGHRALTRVTVRLIDAELLGRLISRAADELDAHIDGPRWQIALENPVRLEAARAAARDAERKARAYAEGVGARLGRPLRLAEPEGFEVRRLRGGLEPVAASAGPMPIDPGEHGVAASIQVTFALEFAGTP